MSRKLFVVILALFMIAGLHSKVRAETPSSQATSQITLHVENKGSTPSSSKPSPSEPLDSKNDSSSRASHSEAQKNKKTPVKELPLTNAQKQVGLLVGGFLLLVGLTCLVVKRKRGVEHE